MYDYINGGFSWNDFSITFGNGGGYNNPYGNYPVYTQQYPVTTNNGNQQLLWLAVIGLGLWAITR